MREHKMIRNLLKYVAVMVLCLGLAIPAHAATETYLQNNTIKLSYTVGDDSEVTPSSDGKMITVTVYNGFFSCDSATLQIYNNMTTAATLSFDYELKNGYTSFTYNTTSGSDSKVLGTGEYVEIVLKGKTGYKVSDAVLTISNISLVAVAEESTVTLGEYDDSLGSATVDAGTIGSGNLENTVDLVASPGADTTFLGWVNVGTGELIDTSANYAYPPAQDVTVIPAFARADAKAWFSAGGGAYLFNDLNKAGNYAKGATNKTIVLMHDGTLPSGDYTIHSGVTLLIPFDSANTLYTTAPETEERYSAPTAYRTLTMADGANIFVEDGGAISVSGKHSSKMNSYNGQPFGPQGFIVMNEGSNITVKSGGVLYAWGYIVGEKRDTNDEPPTGGTVTIESDGTVYECFQVTDYRGGTATNGMTSDDWTGADNNDTYHVFPMSQYYVQNVQVPMTLKAGATENGYFSVAVSKVGNKSAPVPFIGNEGMFRISDGYIVKDYDEKNDRLIIDIYGDIEMAPMFISIAAGFLGMTVDIDSNDYVLPLTNNLTATLHSGHTLDITQDLAILPGAELNIEEGATVNIGTASAKKSVYVYDTDEWDGYCSEHNVKFRGLNYAYDRFDTRTENDLVDAVILVDGTVNAANGYAYTTTGGANIYSTGTGKILDVVPGTSTLYQATQSNTTISYVEIPITSAKLKNANGTYVQSTTDTYTYFEGFWHTSECKNAGYWANDALCACDHQAVAAVVTEKNEYHGTLAATVSAYTRNTGYIQMLTDTEESAIDASDKTVNLDLNGKTVTLKKADGTVGSLTVAALNGFDSATNALGATGSSYGKIVGTVTGTVAPVHTPDSGANANKTYVAVKDDEGLHFHRVRLGIDHYSFYSYNGQGALTFAAAYLGDSKVLGAMVNLGMDVNGTPKWYYDTDKVVAVDTNVTAYSAAADPNSLPGDTTKYNPSGYVLNGTAGIVGLDDSFTIHALLRVKGAGTAQDLTSEDYPGHSATGQTLQMAIDAVKNAGGNDNG